MVLRLIPLNCFTIAMKRTETDSESMEGWIMSMSRYVISAVSLLEVLVKVLTLGLLFGRESYCRSSWNIMDGLTVTLSLVYIFVSLASSGKDNMLSILKALRLLCTLSVIK